MLQIKKISIVLLLFLLINTACKKNEDSDDSISSITSTQNGFAVSYSATICTPCGDWGSPLIHKYSDDAPNGVVITVHTIGDPMHSNKLNTSFSAIRNSGTGIPSFWVADTKTYDDFAMSDFMSSSTTATAGIDYSYEISGSTMTVKTKVKFFSPKAGIYNISVLLLEDGIDGSSSAGSYTQSGTSNSYPNDDYKHDFVLRAASNTNNVGGELLATNPNDESVIENEFSFNIRNNWVNPYPVVIIWKYEASSSEPKYKYINSFKKK